MEGQCYKAVQAAKETLAAGAAVQGDGGKLPDEPETSAKEASEENADAKDKGPWSSTDTAGYKFRIHSGVSHQDIIKQADGGKKCIRFYRQRN